MIPLYKPYIPAIPEVNTILHSGQLAAGVYTKLFESKLQGFFNKNNVASVNSFTGAISVATSTIGLKPGDEIITSPMACLGSTQPYAGAGLKIIWADVDPATGTLNPDDVRKRISTRTKAIVHNHFCGYPGYIDEINTIGEDNGIWVIDDGIECFGTKYKGTLIGNCGTDVTVFSFNPVRVLTTIEGGAITFKDENLFKKSLLIRDCGIDRSRFRDLMGEINPDCDIYLQGYGATLSNVNAYIGVQQFENLENRMLKHSRNAEAWEAALTDVKGIKPLSTINGEPNFWVFGAIADNKIKAIEFFRNKGYYASGVHINNNIYSVFGRQKNLPGVDKFVNSFIALPCGWWLNPDDIHI